MFPMATGHHRKHWTPTTTPGPSTSGRIVLDNFSGRPGRRGRLANSRETAAVAARPPLVGKADRRDQGIEVGAVQRLDLALIGGILQPKVVRDSLVDRDRSQDEQSTVHRAMFGGQRCCLAADLRRVLTFRCRRAWKVVGAEYRALDAAGEPWIVGGGFDPGGDAEAAQPALRTRAAMATPQGAERRCRRRVARFTLRLNRNRS